MSLGPDLAPSGFEYLLLELYALVCGLHGSGAVDGDRLAFECVNGRCGCAGPSSHVRVARTTIMYNGRLECVSRAYNMYTNTPDVQGAILIRGSAKINV